MSHFKHIDTTAAHLSACPPDLYRLIGRNLMALRGKAHLSITQLAQATKLRFADIQLIEAGAMPPSLVQMMLLCQALKCDPGDFFTSVQVQQRRKEVTPV